MTSGLVCAGAQAGGRQALIHGRAWAALAGCRHVVALQIRRGPAALSWYQVLEVDGEEQVVRCGREVAHNDTCFVVVSDDPEARARAFQALAQTPPHAPAAGGVVVGWVGGGTGQRVMCQMDEAVLFHSGLDHHQRQRAPSEDAVGAGMDGAWADWLVMSQADDAVLSDASSFGYSAFAASRRIPVTGDLMLLSCLNHPLCHPSCLQLQPTHHHMTYVCHHQVHPRSCLRASVCVMPDVGAAAGYECPCSVERRRPGS